MEIIICGNRLYFWMYWISPGALIQTFAFGPPQVACHSQSPLQIPNHWSFSISPGNGLSYLSLAAIPNLAIHEWSMPDLLALSNLSIFHQMIRDAIANGYFIYPSAWPSLLSLLMDVAARVSVSAKTIWEIFLLLRLGVGNLQNKLSSCIAHIEHMSWLLVSRRCQNIFRNLDLCSHR